MDIQRATRRLWWLAGALWAGILSVALAGETARHAIGAEPETVFVDDFEFRCGFGTDAPRQMIGDVSFLSNPGRHYLQPLDRFGSLFGFYFDCPMVHGACTDVTPFSGTNTVPILRTSRNGYVALAFTTEHLEPGQTAGYQVVSTSNQVFSLTEWSISPRCGDFDVLGPWLVAHPQCHAMLTPKAGAMRWTIAPSALNCRIVGDDGAADPGRTWYLNFRVIDCDAPGATCPVNIKNQRG